MQGSRDAQCIDRNQNERWQDVPSDLQIGQLDSIVDIIASMIHNRVCWLFFLTRHGIPDRFVPKILK